jgi:hypothetical protein
MKQTTPVAMPTQDQIDLVNTLELSANPMDRLSGPFYEIKKNLILVDYYKMMEAADEEPDRIEAQDVLQKTMETLQHSFLSDLKSELYAHFGMHAIHFELTHSAESLFL